MNIVYENRHKEYIFNIFLLLLGLSIITFFKGSFPQTLGKFLLFIGLILFLLILFLEKNLFFIKNFLIYSIFFYLFFYIANYDVGEVPSKEFFKKTSQILFCLLIFSYFLLQSNNKVNVNIITYTSLSIGFSVIIILFLKNNLNIDILHWFELFFSEKIYIYNDEVIKKNLLENYFFRNNPYCILLNTLILFYLIQNKFRLREYIILFLLILFIFMSTNLFSKIVTLMILLFYFLNKKKYGEIILKSFLFLIFFLITIFLSLELQIIIDFINFIFDKIFRFTFDLEKGLVSNYIIAYDDKKKIIIKIISLSNFEFFSNFNEDINLKKNSNYDFTDIRRFYYDYYLGGIFRLIIIKFKLLSLYDENFSKILNSSFHIRLFGGNRLVLKEVFTPEIIQQYFNIIQNLKNNYYSLICLNELHSYDDVKCISSLISKEYPNLSFSFESASNIRQKLTSTHNSFLTTLIVFNKFYIIFILNILLVIFYFILKGNKDIIFILLSVIFIFFFEDYLFFNRYNISIIFWLILGLSIKSVIQKRVN